MDETLVSFWVRRVRVSIDQANFPDGSMWTEHVVLERNAFITCKLTRPYRKLEEPLIWPAATKRRYVQGSSTRVDGLMDNVPAGALGDCAVFFQADSQSRHPPNALLLMRAGLHQTSMPPAEFLEFACEWYLQPNSHRRVLR